MIWKNLEHLVSQTAFCGTQGQSYLKPINLGLPRLNRDKLDP